MPFILSIGHIGTFLIHNRACPHTKFAIILVEYSLTKARLVTFV